MGRRGRIVFIAVSIVTVGIFAVAFLAGGGEEDPESEIQSLEAARAQLAGAPAPLASLHAQANELIGGGEDAFRARLEELKGYPVVVNKWASWCEPCRAEFPMFQNQSLKRGKKVAFIGVNSTDNDAAAERFLERYPVVYPSYKDPDQEVAGVFDGVAAFPTTAFYDADGKLQYLKQGGYSRESKLARDIRRYALK